MLRTVYNLLHRQVRALEFQLLDGKITAAGFHDGVAMLQTTFREKYEKNKALKARLKRIEEQALLTWEEANTNKPRPEYNKTFPVRTKEVQAAYTECPICVTALVEPYCMPGCGHQACHRCIERCYYLNNQCPLCKKPIGPLENLLKLFAPNVVVSTPPRVPSNEISIFTIIE